MERIVLEVGDDTAKAWRNASAKLRNAIGKDFEQLLNAVLKNTKEANFELLLKDARQEAAKNGLTEEILNKLLNEEE